MPKMRLGWYAGASTALAGSVVLSAFLQRANFYSAMVYLAQSNFCLLILVNFTLFLYSSFMYGLIRLCFGTLRAVEVEQLTERAWFAITETCLAMTIFREELGAWFLVMFTALVTGKVWGWIGDGRVEVLEQQPPANPRLFHLRLSVSLALSFLYDVWLLRYTTNTVIQQAKPNMMVMFLFEFAVVATSSWRTGVRYLLSIAEQNIIKTQTRKRLLERKLEVRRERETLIKERHERDQAAIAAGEEVPKDDEPLPNEEDIDEMDIEVPGWAAKGELVLWLDLVTDMIKLGIYVALFFMLLRFYGLPIHMMRDLFMTSRDFLKRLGALLRYRRAIQEMKKYPDATAEDLSRENTCIICREEMHPWNENNDNSTVDRVRPKKLPCNHILHLGCLKSWLERQQVCPTCRTPVTEDRARAPQNRAAGLRIQIGGGVDAPGQPPAQQPGNADNAAAPQAPNQPGPQGGAGGARVFNLGPLRLGFGAGPQVQDLARQFGIPQGPANPGVAQAAAVAPAPTPAPAPLPTTTQVGLSENNLQNVSFLLHTAEAQIQRELQSIQASQHELQTLSLLLAELQRIRQRQQIIGAPMNPPAVGVSPSMGLPTLPYTIHQPGPFPGAAGFGPFPGMPPRIGTPIIGRHIAGPNATAIPAGSPDLPEGVVIPPGWSLMPLQRHDGSQSVAQPVPTAPMAPMAPTSVPSAANGETSGAGPSLAGATQSTPLTNSVGEGGPSTRIPPTAPSGEAAARPEQPSVISPSPVMPNWGGSAQLFRNSSRLDNNDTASQAISQAEAADDQISSSSSASASAVPVMQAHAPQEEGAGKEKSRAVTVEDASDSSDSEEDEEDEDDE